MMADDANLPFSFGKLWIVIRDANWLSHDQTSNCLYLNQFVDSMQQKNTNQQLGFNTNLGMWYDIFGECPEVSEKVDLWYKNEGIERNFNDYRQIGGWKTPTLKLSDIGTVDMCGGEFWWLYAEQQE